MKWYLGASLHGGLAKTADPHRDPHAEMRGKGERAQERKFSFLSRAFIAFGVYITCVMKLPMVCAASSYFCLVAWV